MATSTVSLAANTAVLTTTETQLGTATAVLNASGLPTTVERPTTSVGLVSSGASMVTTECTWARSAASLPSSCGVPTQMKCTSAQSAISR